VVYINGIGFALPKRYIDSHQEDDHDQCDIDKMIELGYDGVYAAQPSERETLIIEAVNTSLIEAEIHRNEISCVVHCYSATFEHLVENQSSRIRKLIDVPNAGYVHLDQGCNSSILALEYAHNRLRVDDTCSSVMILMYEFEAKPIYDRFKSFSSSVMSDGACAVILTKRKSNLEVMATHIISEGQYSEIWRLLGSGTEDFPKCKDVLRNLTIDVEKTGSAIFNDNKKKDKMFSVLIENNKNVYKNALTCAGVNKSDIDYLITYNIGKKVYENICAVLETPINKTSYACGKKYGHVGSSDVFINLKMSLHTLKSNKYRYIALFSAGIGFSWGAGIIKYNNE